jgi:ATP-dependent 26S proteasome regulatory subunit
VTGLERLPAAKLPPGLVLEKSPAFVPRMVMTPELHTVVREVILQWQHRKQFAGLLKFGIRPLDRLLFYGPPGNGKTMACQWMCQQLGVPLYRVQCERLVGAYLGETAKALARVTEHLSALTAPALCLFDEVESIFVDRAAADGQCDRERGSALTVFMQALDRWQAPTLIVMCTNLIQQVDRALLSRVEMKLEFQGPTPEQAREVVEYWCELLCEHGADDWGPRFVAQLDQGNMPESFRQLTQLIGRAARDWVAGGIHEA